MSSCKAKCHICISETRIDLAWNWRRSYNTKLAQKSPFSWISLWVKQKKARSENVFNDVFYSTWNSTDVAEIIQKVPINWNCLVNLTQPYSYANQNPTIPSLYQLTFKHMLQLNSWAVGICRNHRSCVKDQSIPRMKAMNLSSCAEFGQ